MFDDQSNSARSYLSKRLESVATSLGTVRLQKFVEPLFSKTFSLAADDPRLLNNSLAPGHLPLELSFSERQPQCLRLAIEPLLTVSAAERQLASTETVRKLVSKHAGQYQRRRFEQAIEPWTKMADRDDLSFGAFFGCVLDYSGLTAVKVYYEISTWCATRNPETTRSLAVARTVSNHLRPLFVTVACTRDSIHQRLTILLCDRVSLTDICRTLSTHGLAKAAQELEQRMSSIFDPRAQLPEHSVALGISLDQLDPHIKCEFFLTEIEKHFPHVREKAATQIAVPYVRGLFDKKKPVTWSLPAVLSAYCKTASPLSVYLRPLLPDSGL